MKSESSSTTHSTPVPEVINLVKGIVCDDAPARDSICDVLGFGPYVRVLADFLMNEETKTPLTVSVEGEWGSGKTSFLLQLQNAVGARFPTVFFNAWRHDKDEAMWAAFALECIREIRRQRKASPFACWMQDLRHFLSLVSWRSAFPDLVRLVFRFAVLVAIFGFCLALLMRGDFNGLGNADQATDNANLIRLLVAGGGSFASLIVLLDIGRRVTVLWGDPFEIQLRKYVAQPDYGSRVAFIETFHEDFARVLKSYISGSKLFIFIDDLDRCDILRSSELMQAINMLASASVVGPIFILGMDRKIVAASLSAKYQTVMPYLFTSNATAVDKAQIASVLDYGYSFMDKFIQLPFKVPRASEKELIGILDGSAIADGETFVTITNVMIDTERARNAIEAAVVLLENNPRRLKQFLNVFRLYVSLFLAMKRLHNTYVTHEERPGMAELTLEKLGRFLAIIVRWPRLIDAIESDPAAINELQKRALGLTYEARASLIELEGNIDLLQYLRKIENGSFPSAEWTEEERRLIFSLEEIDVARLLQVAPKTATPSEVRRPQTQVEPVPPGPIHQGTGNPALALDHMSWHKSALELLVPLETGRVAHYRYTEVDGCDTWVAKELFGSRGEVFDGIALIQSNYNLGNLEALGRSLSDRKLVFFYHPSKDDLSWKAPYALDFRVSGNPQLLQSAVGVNGNFELVVATEESGLQHFWRDNSQNGRPWIKEVRFARSLRSAEPIAIFESVNNRVSDLLVFAVSDGNLYTIYRKGYRWGLPNETTESPKLGGRPAVIAKSGVPGGFELFAPLELQGMGHYSLDPVANRWILLSGLATELGPISSVAAVGGPDKSHIVALCTSRMYHLIYDVRAGEWTEPILIEGKAVASEKPRTGRIVEEPPMTG